MRYSDMEEQQNEFQDYFNDDTKVYNLTRSTKDIDEYNHLPIYYDEFQKYRKKEFTLEEARKIGDSIGVDWNKYDIEQFRMGLGVELEHGTINPMTNVTNDDPIMTGKIALAHLNELPDYYTKLAKIEDISRRYYEDI